MTTQAIRPDFIVKNMPSLVQDEKAGKGGADEEEKQLFHMYQTVGWKVYQEYIEKLLQELDEVNNIAIAQGLGFDQIGQNTVVITQVKDIINKGLNKVMDAKEACEEAILKNDQ